MPAAFREIAFALEHSGDEPMGLPSEEVDEEKGRALAFSAHRIELYHALWI